MDLKKNYVKVMIDTLYKKNRILDSILTLSSFQKSIVSDMKNNLEKFEQTILEKQELIDELLLLDEGFQLLYDRLKDSLFEEADQYREEIGKMQKLITEISHKSMQVQTIEEENRELISQQATTIRKGTKKYFDTKSAVNKYYKNMQKLSYITPQFMDKKK